MPTYTVRYDNKRATLTIAPPTILINDHPARPTTVLTIIATHPDDAEAAEMLELVLPHIVAPELQAQTRRAVCDRRAARHVDEPQPDVVAYRAYLEEHWVTDDKTYRQLDRFIRCPEDKAEILAMSVECRIQPKKDASFARAMECAVELYGYHIEHDRRRFVDGIYRYYALRPADCPVDPKPKRGRGRPRLRDAGA